MIFTASKSDLVTGINTVIKAVPSTTTMPILRCLLLEADRCGLTLTANDMELAIKTHVTAEVTEGGTIAIDAKMLSDIVRKLPSSDVSVTTDENLSVTIKSGKAKFQIGGQDGSSFTGLPDIKPQTVMTLRQDDFRSMVQSTIFATDMNAKMKIMSGECIEVKDGTFSLIALDGHRVAVRKVSLPVGCNENVRVVVPGKTMNDVSRILTGTSDEVILSIATNHIMFQFNETVVASRLIDGEFYDINSMISNEFAIKVTADRSALIECVERAGLFVKEGDKKPIIFTINSNESMEISIQSPTGSMAETLDIDKTGADLCIGFNPRFMAEALKAIADDEVTLNMNGPKAPCFIQSDSYLYLILPVNFVN